jgi:hypothetical protein
MDPFTGVSVEDELEPLKPARTIISVGPSACIRCNTQVNIADRQPIDFTKWKTHANLTERCDEIGPFKYSFVNVFLKGP